MPSGWARPTTSWYRTLVGPQARHEPVQVGVTLAARDAGQGRVQEQRTRLRVGPPVATSAAG